MPLRDGTGPLGFGAGTGRGRGRCKSGLGDNGFGRSMFTGKRGWFFGLAAPVMIAAVRDLTNPSGLLRQLVRALLSDKKSKKPQILHATQYSVVEENNNNVAELPKNLSGKSENEYI